MSNPSPKGVALVTGASTGIGAIYADRLAKRGYDLILVARNKDRLNSIAERLRVETGRQVTALQADLNDKAGLAKVEAVLHEDPSITMLVNNAGVGSVASILQADVDKMEAMIDLNITALTRLTYAAAPAFVARGKGTIINISSVVGYRGGGPERRLQRVEVLRAELRPFAAEGSGRKGRARSDRAARRHRHGVLGHRRLCAAEVLRDHHAGRGPCRCGAGRPRCW